MPRAYELLIGLTEVDSESPFYRKHFPGFDGRRGCEGCVEDIRKIRELTHYLGFEPVALEPLMNERATRARVLELLASFFSPEYGMKEEDIFLIYMTCHGRTMGGGSTPDSSQMFDPSAVNMFLLHDGPIFNMEIWFTLFACANSLGRGPRIFTIVDACHAGLGLDAMAAYLARLFEYLASLLLILLKPHRNTPFTPQAINMVSQLQNKVLVQMQQLPQLDPLLQMESMKSINQTLLNEMGNAGLRLTHFGATRDELSALGGPNGSLFTRRLRQLYLNGGYSLSYSEFLTQLKDLIPLAYTPQMATIPIKAPDDHFSKHERIFQIDP